MSCQASLLTTWALTGAHSFWRELSPRDCYLKFKATSTWFYALSFSPSQQACRWSPLAPSPSSPPLIDRWWGSSRGLLPGSSLRAAMVQEEGWRVSGSICHCGPRVPPCHPCRGTLEKMEGRYVLFFLTNMQDSSKPHYFYTLLVNLMPGQSAVGG